MIKSMTKFTPEEEKIIIDSLTYGILSPEYFIKSYYFLLGIARDIDEIKSGEEFWQAIPRYRQYFRDKEILALADYLKRVERKYGKDNDLYRLGYSFRFELRFMDGFRLVDNYRGHDEVVSLLDKKWFV